jgi:hypothetical protein
MNVGPDMVYQALFDQDAFLGNKEALAVLHPIVQSRDGRNPFGYLPDSIQDNSIIQEAEKDDQAILDKIDEEEGAIRNWVDDYERSGNYGEEVRELDDDV